jgi:GT2 family glycosyltransferase
MAAPIVLFVYNRLNHTKRTVEALQRNEGAANADLFIYSDGPRTAGDEEKVNEVRNYLHTINGFRNVTIISRSRNFGLANNIIDGVTEIVNRFDEVIVLEDDLVTSPFFLRFMNDGLARYRNNEEVISIHGYIYPVSEKLPDTFFLKGADCWGWATWRRGWQLFNADASKLMEQLVSRKQQYDFDLDGCVAYTRMLQNQIDGKIDSWAIRWHASAFLHNKLTLYPGRTLVQNIGADDSGTHMKSAESHEDQLFEQAIHLQNIPVVQSNEARNSICRYFYHRKSLPGKLKKKLKWGY